MRAQRTGLRGTARSGGWLFLRTVCLRAALLVTVGVATGIGTHELAGWQIAFTIFSTAAFALDALAIAAQALIGKGLGSGDLVHVRRVVRRTVAWGLWFGILVGAVIAALSGVLGIAFTGQAAVAALVQPALLVLAVAQPVAGVVFVLDGVLMGANDARYLAVAALLNLVPFLPALWIITATGVDGRLGLLWLASAFFGLFMLARLGTLAWRLRTDRWTKVAA